MKYVIIMILFSFIISCRNEKMQYEHTIYENEILNSAILKNIDTPEKALICGYLFVYGNECDATTDKIKCKILDLLQIEDECSDDHLDFLKQWFQKDLLMWYKLQKCPTLPIKFAIQNTIKKISINRNNDTMSITIKVIGMNTSQEKNWNIEQTEVFLINENSFQKSDINGTHKNR